MWLFATALIALSLSAQTKTDKAEVTWGPDEKIGKDGTFTSVIADDGDAVYQLISRPYFTYVQRMDLGLHITYQQPLDLVLDKKDLSLKNILITQSHVVVFASLYDKKLDENQLYMETYDKRDFRPEQRLTKIALIPAEKARRSGSFDVKVSPDKSKVLVYMAKPNDKGANRTFAIQVFDSDMKPVWSKEIILPYSNDDFSVGQVEIDNDGNVVGLGRKFAEKQEATDLTRAGRPTYENHLLVLTKDDEALQDHPIVVVDKFLQDMTLKIGANGNIVCGGFFSNNSDLSIWSIRGTFFLSVDPQTKQVVHESYKDFSDNFITQYMTGKEAKKAAKKADRKGEEMELPDYVLHDIIVNADGSAVMIAEQYHKELHSVSPPAGPGVMVNVTTYNSYLYYYNDIIVVSIDPEGEIKWASKVPKRQCSANDGGRYSSCAVEVKGDNIYLIFNDSGKNLSLRPGDKINRFDIKGKDALTVLVTLDSNGNVAREALFPLDIRDVILRPKDCVELSNDKMIVYADRKNRFRFGEVEFK